jgi:hypothetical protein
MTHSSPDARDVRAGVGLGDAEARDPLPPDRGHQVALLLLLGAELQDRRRRHVGVHGDAHREPAGVRARELLGQHEVGEVVPTLTAVGLRHREPEEAELAHAPEDRVRERRLLPLLRVRRQLARDVRTDRLPQRLVLLGEDEVAARRRVVGLEDVGGGHVMTLPG